MDDILTTAQKIEFKTRQIEELADRLEQAGLEKASSSADYDKAIAVTTLQLRNGVIEEWEGEEGGITPGHSYPCNSKGNML